MDTSPYSFQSSIYVNQEKMPDYSGLDIALIGLTESRGSHEAQSKESPEYIRKMLYRLKKGFGDYGIVDLGNFRNGPKLEDTYDRLKEVCSYLMDKGIIPVLFGGTHDLDIGQFRAYETKNKWVSMLTVDNCFDLNSESIPVHSHLSTIFQHHPNFLFNHQHIGYQGFLVHETEQELLSSLSFEAERLGVIKQKLMEVEPFIREADLVSIDMAALNTNYSMAASGSNTYGFTGEEACQICWYAGQNEKLSSIGIYNYNAEYDDVNYSNAFVIGTMIWYFIEGFYHRKGDKNFRGNDYTVYEVHLGGDPESIRFYKSKRTERWWMEIPNDEGHGLFNRSRMISCNYSDYTTAQNGEVPERWFNAIKRF